MLFYIKNLATGRNGYSREKINIVKNKFSSCRLGNGVTKTFIRYIIKLNKILS